jgi:hypothetical protein
VLSPFDATAHVESMGRHTECLLERPAKVTGAQAGELGHGRKRDLVGDVFFDIARDSALLRAGEPAPPARTKAHPSGFGG